MKNSPNPNRPNFNREQLQIKIVNILGILQYFI